MKKALLAPLFLTLIILVSGCVWEQPSVNNNSTDQNITTDAQEDWFCPQREQGPKIILIVDESVYSELKYEIDRFADDVKSDVNAEILLASRNWESADEVKEFLDVQEYDGLMLIGDIPIPKVNFNMDSEETSDFFYAEKNGEFQGWVSRITPATGVANRLDLLRDYFDRNHDYRTGELDYDGFFFYGPDYSLNSNNGETTCYNNIIDDVDNFRLGSLNVIVPEYSNEATKSRYIDQLKNNYAIALINAHGSPILHQDSIKYEDIKEAEPNAMIYVFDSCSVGDVSVDNNIAQAYVFEGNGLFARTASINLWGTSPCQVKLADYVRVIAAGEPLYNAFTQKDHYIEYLGDITLSLKKKQPDCQLCVDKTELEGSATMYTTAGKTPLTADAKVRIKNLGSKTCHLLGVYCTGVSSCSHPDIFSMDKSFTGTLEPGQETSITENFVYGSGADEMTPGNFIERIGTEYIISDSLQGIIKISINGTMRIE